MGERIAANVGQEFRRQKGCSGVERTGAGEVEGDVEVDANFIRGGGRKLGEGFREIGPAQDFAGGGSGFDLVEIDGLDEGTQRIKGGVAGFGAEGG
jgi:hypothetical protein